MSGLVGADVAQLRSLARTFEDAADRLDRHRLTVGNQIQISAWVGPFAANFRLVWASEHSVRVASAVALLHQKAVQLRKNADEQDRASAVTGVSATSGARGSRSVPPDRVPPANVEGMIQTLHGMDSNDGIRVQKVLGPDREIRYVVYINGTNNSDNKLLNSAVENASAVQGLIGPTDLYLNSLLARVVDPKDAEIMVIGYSQGGMHAEILAQSGFYNVTDVITLDSPQITQFNNLHGANVVRLWDSTREPIGEMGVFNSEIYNPLSGGIRDVVGRLTGEGQKGIQKYFLGQSDASEMDGVWGGHLSQTAHEQIAQQFDASQDAQDKEIKAGIARYQTGTIVQDYD